ncbi:MAG: acyl-CoA thioesterase [Actinomycetota bacterium]
MSIDDKLATQAEFVDVIQARPVDHGTAVGDVPDWFGPIAFGGFIVAQTLHAATTTVDAAKGRPHSLHCYFLRPVAAGTPVNYTIRHLRDGRTFTTRQVDAAQNGALVCTMTCSFTTDTDGYEYELDVVGAPPDVNSIEDFDGFGAGPWVQRVVGPIAPAADGTRRSTHRMFVRLPAPIGDDPMLHAAIVAMITDMTFTGARPLHLDLPMDGIVSLDHSVWFHRPLRPDDWIYYDMHSLVNTGGRGALRGTLHGPDGRLAVSVAQEQLLRVLPEQ